MESLAAAVQFGDFRGEAAADESDHAGLQKLAGKCGIHDRVVGVQLDSGNGGQFIHACLFTTALQELVASEGASLANYRRLRVIKHTLDGVTIAEWFSHFKRVSHGMSDRLKSVSEMECDLSGRADSERVNDVE